jgi:hypothetical protein
MGTAIGSAEAVYRIAAIGDPSETMVRVVDFEVFRPALEKALAYGDGAMDDRPPYDPVAMFKVRNHPVRVAGNDNTSSDVWADTAYRCRANEAWLTSIGRISRVHRKKPKSRLMSSRSAGGNAKRSAVLVCIEHVFARQEDQMGLFIRTIGIARSKTKIGLANLAYNIDRLIFHKRRAAMDSCARRTWFQSCTAINGLISRQWRSHRPLHAVIRRTTRCCGCPPQPR